jgi:hypothetical protein
MKRSFVTLLLVLAGLSVGAEVWAEAFIDFYGGGAFTSDRSSDVVVDPQFFNPVGLDPPAGEPNVVLRRTSVHTNFDDAVTFGGRGGYWFGKWAGLALDVFTFETELDAVGATQFTEGSDLRVIPISALLMLRWPLLESDQYPLGRMHPYIGGGPSLFITRFEGFVDLAVFEFPVTGTIPRPIVNVEPAGDFESENVDIGFELLVGLDFQILPFLGLFGEYRYTQSEPVWNDVVPASVNYEALSTDVLVPLRTHHIVGGVSFRF